MTSRFLVASATFAIAAGCGGTRPTTTPTAPPVCEPTPFSTEYQFAELATGSGAFLYATANQWILSMPSQQCVSIEFMLEPAIACAGGGPCGQQLSIDRLQELDGVLQGIDSHLAQVGGQIVTVFPGEDGVVVSWPRDAPPEPVITGVGGTTPPPSEPDPSGPTLPCCPACAPCVPGHCNSTPPIRPFVGIELGERCNCEGVQDAYCPGGGVPTNAPEDCKCVEACCAPSSSS